MPLYCVAFYKSFSAKLKELEISDIKTFLKDKEVSLVQKCIKTINSELPTIMSKKGCDASNIYDEEASDKEFSDDEAEKEYKRNKKNKRKNKRQMGDLEEGEIMDEG